MSWPSPIYLIVINEFSSKPLLGIAFRPLHQSKLDATTRCIPYVVHADDEDQLKVYFCSWYGESPALSKITGSPHLPHFRPAPELVLVYQVPVIEHEPRYNHPKNVTQAYDTSEQVAQTSSMLSKLADYINKLPEDANLTTPTPNVISQNKPASVAPEKHPLPVKSTPQEPIQPLPVASLPTNTEPQSQPAPQPPPGLKGMFKRFFK